ncbi:GDSL-type esterase/lipase family protein [Hymenobacter convexus]|uniref:GDSL-type esterase/lipase family protein n=1 Tax=Hymenobacter sp. CA1UV-4 TaxID=3063782 RepID=UPI002712F036|nr:GDSL-type esterase/lipase family protein [Hymenobacter sp. CA1UV-4]MDO7851343.1 GDSL-type esterase/lipase family protein [Hymenobacter sp. CA1UV-4]
MKYCLHLFVVWLLLGSGRPVCAQALGRLDSLRAAYPFLRTSANHIENAQRGLQHFYRRLAQLPVYPNELPGERVSVVHIGDSHLQADEFSGRVRRELQRTYGNAGRGLAFPFGVAKTGGSATFRTAPTAGRWRARRVLAAPDSTLPIGLSGISLATTDTGAAFTLRIPARRWPDYRFSRLTLLRAPGATALDWQVHDARGRLLATVPGAGPGLSSAVVFDSLRDFVELRTVRRSSRQISARLYGLLLDNGRAGLVYHAIGVNGAAVRHYNRAPQFFAQLPLLQPDLLIVSLGTNDAYDAGFDPQRFAQQLDTLVSRLRRGSPQADVLLTAPADSYRARRHRNPDLARLRTVLQAYCTAHDLAYWDFAVVQGGYGSMRAWQTHGLAQPDLVHFTTKGYELQGLLLYLALQDGFSLPPPR